MPDVTIATERTRLDRPQGQVEELDAMSRNEAIRRLCASYLTRSNLSMPNPSLPSIGLLLRSVVRVSLSPSSLKNRT
jgi:hypothetical protein